MIAEFQEIKHPPLNFGTLLIGAENKKELDIIKTMFRYYPYDTMEKLRKEYGNRFPDVKTEDVVALIDKISKALDKK